MQIWIYGENLNAVQAITAAVSAADTVIGTSIAAMPDTCFPQSGLTQAMCAAIRNELDLLLVSAQHLLGHTPQQIEETTMLFRNYGVTVKSFSSIGSSSS